MEDIGTEVSLKIRSAVKAKLMELGAFVDDELPDYIMVMVANKRSKQQMDADLQLFLGGNTTNFTGWLHTVLQKLEEVTIANNLALSQKIAADVTKHVETTERSSRSKVSMSENEDDGHKHKHEKKRKSSDGSSSNKKHIKENKSVVKTSSGKKSTKKPSEVPSGSASASPGISHTVSHVSDTDSGVKSVDARTSSEVSSSVGRDLDSHQKTLPVLKQSASNVQTPVQKSSPKPSPGTQQSDEDDEDFINIKDDAEAMELLDTELSESSRQSRQTQQTSSMSKDNAAPTDAIAASADEEVDELEQQRENLLRDLKLLDKPSRSSGERSSTLQNRLGSKVTSNSVLDRLGAKTDSKPRLNIIDPNELDIVRPTPREVEMTKQKVADRLGRRSAMDKEDSAFADASKVEAFREKHVVSSSNERRESVLGEQKEDELETVKLSVKDRLGARPVVGSKRTVSVIHSDKKNGDKSEISRPTVMDRLGKKVDADSSKDRKVSTADTENVRSRVADRLGKRLTPDCPTGLEPAKLSVMDRLGKRSPMSSESNRKNLDEADDVNAKKRLARVINIKEALQAEAQQGNPIKRRADEQSKEGEVPRKRSLLSRVVAVKRSAAEKEEEYDPSNPAVASVVRIQPRPKVPAAMQATKNLLLKAMAEAQKSVTSAPRRNEQQHGESLYSKKYRGATQPMAKINVANTTKQQDEYVDEDKEEFPYDEDESMDVEGKGVKKDVLKSRVRLKQGLTSGSLRRVGQKIVVDLPADEKMSPNEDQMHVDNSGDKRSGLKAEDEPEDEEGDVTYEEVFDDDLNEEDLIEMTVSNGDSNLGNVSPINNEENATERVEYVPTKIKHRAKPVQNAVRVSSPQFVVTLDGLDPNIFSPRKRTVDTTGAKEREEEAGVTSPVPTLDPVTDDRIHNWLLSLDRAKKEEERSEQTTSPVVYKKPKLVTAPVAEPVKAMSLERCKYWPACSKGDLCEFLHPSTPCKLFPGCKFGDRCLYIHPNCKFDISCTRRDCPYSHHSGVRGGGSQVSVLGSGKSRPHTQPLCKFYPKCSNVNCPFLHPKPCRFGRACTNRECTFFHEEIPTAEKLKWVNSNRF